MNKDLAKTIEEYKETPLYQVFHSYHPIDEEEDRLVFNPNIKKPTSQPTPQATDMAENKNLAFAKQLAQKNDTKANPSTKSASQPLNSQQEEAMTDKTPQNDSFVNKQAAIKEPIDADEPNRPIKVVKPTATPLVNQPATSGIAKTPSDTSVTIPRNTTSASYGGPKNEDSGATTQITVTPKTNSASITIPNTKTAPAASENQTSESIEIPAHQKKQTTEVARKPIAPKVQTPKKDDASTAPKPNKEENTNNQVAANTTNLLQDVLAKKKTTPEPAAKNDAYEQIKKAGQDISFIEESHRLELAFKKDLAKIPLKQLNVYNIDDDSKSFIPFNTSLFNVLGSVVVGKAMYILFIFRNGKNIAIAPEGWAKNERQVTVENGFQFYYKENDIDFAKLTETLKIMAGSITPTNDYTEFWLKYMPAIDATE